MVEKLTFSSLAAALVDICGILLCDKTAYYRMAFYFPTRCTCVMIMFLNHLFDMPHLMDGLSRLISAQNERNTLFVRMTHFWDHLFHLMKYGTNTLYVAFIILFIIYSPTQKDSHNVLVFPMCYHYAFNHLKPQPNSNGKTTQMSLHFQPFKSTTKFKMGIRQILFLYTDSCVITVLRLIAELNDLECS
jgi:hypothetical protein